MQNATLSLIMSVRPSLWNNSAPTGRIFMKPVILRIFQKSVERIQISLKSDKNSGYFRGLCTFMIISRRILLKVTYLRQNCRENQNTQYVFSNSFLKIMPLMRQCEKTRCKARHATDDNIIRHIHFADFKTKATHTLRIRNTCCFSTATVFTRVRLHFMLYVHCLSCLFRNSWQQRGSLTITLTSHVGGSGFEFQSAYLLSWPIIFVVFLSPPCKCCGRVLK